MRGVFGFGEEISTLITWTTRAYLATLTGYTIHEIAIRAFYARKEPLVPLYAIGIRLTIFLVIGILGVTFFQNIGAPIIAFAEIALLIEAIFILSWLSKRTHEPLHTSDVVFKGLIAAVVSGVVTYLVALYLPGGAIITALIGMIVGGVVALAIVWNEAKQLLKL